MLFLLSWRTVSQHGVRLQLFTAFGIIIGVCYAIAGRGDIDAPNVYVLASVGKRFILSAVCGVVFSILTGEGWGGLLRKGGAVWTLLAPTGSMPKEVSRMAALKA